MTDAPGALDGIRVVEIAAGQAVAICAQHFAQCGAEVIRVEPPDGDEIRRAGPFPGDRFDIDSGGLHRTLNGGKRSVAADVTTTAGAGRAAALIASADLLVTSWRAPAALPLGDLEEMRERFPNTIYLSISPFGMSGPRAAWHADSQVLEGLAGMTYVSGAPDREPLSLGIDIADYFGAANGWLSGLAALGNRRAGADVHSVDVSIHDSLTMADDHNLSVYLGNGAVRRRYFSRILPSYPTDIMECKDGYIAFVPRGAQRNFAEKISEFFEQPELEQHEIFTNTQERVVRWREFDAIASPWLKRHTVAEVLQRSDELGLGLAEVPTVRDLLSDPHLEAHGFWRELADGTTQPGTGASFSRTPARVEPAPALGADDALATLAEQQQRSARVAPLPAPQRAAIPTNGRPPSPLFEGLRVVDLTQGWVGPLVTRILAELGGDVVKVERAGTPNGLYTNRTLFPAGNNNAGAFYNRNIYFTVRNAGKRGMMLALEQPEGIEIIMRMLEQADVLVENYQPHVTRKFGLDYEQLRERFPGLVVCSISGYGQDGPYAARPAVGMTLEPASGVTSVTGYPGGTPMKTGQTWVDPYVGLYATGALFAALLHRQRTGEGQHVNVSMFETTVPLLAPFIADELLNGRASGPRGNRRPRMVRGSYPCDGDDNWVSISARGDEGWRALCSAAGHDEWAADPRFVDDAARQTNHDALDAVIGRWTAALDKFDVSALLQAAGVAAGPVLMADELLADEQLAHRELFDQIEFPDLGPLPIQRYVSAKFDGVGVPARAPAPGLGEHTDEVLEALGFSAAERSRLRDAHITDGGTQLWSEPTPNEASVLPYERYAEMGSILRIDERPKVEVGD